MRRHRHWCHVVPQILIAYPKMSACTKMWKSTESTMRKINEFRKWDFSQQRTSVTDDEVTGMTAYQNDDWEVISQDFYSISTPISQTGNSCHVSGRSQGFSTGETIPDIMLFWVFESRGAIITPHMTLRAHQPSIPQKINTDLILDPNPTAQYSEVDI